MDDQVFCLHQQYNDFEAFCENVRHWDLDYCQLDRGTFSSDLLMFGNATTLFTRARLGRRLLQTGAAPAGLVTFGLLAAPGIRIHWRNLDIHGDRLFIFPPGGELHSISQPDFDVFVLSLSEKILDRTCQSLELPAFRKLAGRNEAFNCHPHSMLLLRKWLQQTAARIANNSSAADNRLYLQQLEEELAERLITILTESTDPVSKPVMRKRDRALRIAVNHLEKSDRPVTSVQELCAVANASERTLQYAFRERYGQSPKTFTLTHRLNNVRKLLRRTDPNTTRISDIAEHHGFLHMSQFAADYRRLFGELPSDTLRHCR